MKRAIIIFLCTVVLFSSCDKQTLTDLGDSTMFVDNGQHVWTSMRHTSVLTIQGDRKYLNIRVFLTDSSQVVIALNIPLAYDNSVPANTYHIGYPECSLTFDDRFDNLHAQAGDFVITENDVANKTISGTFNVSGIIHGANQTIWGNFNKLKYDVLKKNIFNPSFTCKIDGQPFEATFFDNQFVYTILTEAVQENPDHKVIASKGAQRFELTINAATYGNPDCNQFFLDSMAYQLGSNQEYTMSVSSFQINTCNSENKIISGTFSANGIDASNDTINITDGVFSNVSYENLDE